MNAIVIANIGRPLSEKLNVDAAVEELGVGLAAEAVTCSVYNAGNFRARNTVRRFLTGKQPSPEHASRCNR